MKFLVLALALISAVSAGYIAPYGAWGYGGWGSAAVAPVAYSAPVVSAYSAPVVAGYGGWGYGAPAWGGYGGLWKKKAAA